MVKDSMDKTDHEASISKKPRTKKVEITRPIPPAPALALATSNNTRRTILAPSSAASALETSSTLRSTKPASSTSSIPTRPLATSKGTKSKKAPTGPPVLSKDTKTKEPEGLFACATLHQDRKHE